MGNARHKVKHLPAKLRAIRKHLGLSQTKLAKQLEIDPYHRISEWESGRREPDTVIVLRYARVAKVPMEWLADDEIDLPF